MSECNLDASLISWAIYQGSLPPPGRAVRECGFDVLVLCAQEYQPPKRSFPGVVVIRVPMDDAELSSIEWMRAHEASVITSNLASRGAKILITCQAGLNRSGLVTALTLLKLKEWSPRNTIKLIRQRRKGSLFNESFVKAILNFGSV